MHGSPIPRGFIVYSQRDPILQLEDVADALHLTTESPHFAGLPADVRAYQRLLITRFYEAIEKVREADQTPKRRFAPPKPAPAPTCSFWRRVRRVFS